MKFLELISEIHPEKHLNDLDSEITGVSCDSRLVKPGDLFVTWQGARADGMTFVEEALKRGAAGLCLDKAIFPAFKVPCVLVKDSRKALAQIACRFYGNPASRLKVIGVTGTNGKTTVAFMIASILEAAGLNPGLLGTIHYRIGHRLIPSERTTPESLYLQRYFKEMLDEGSQAAVMEVSSHALAQGRVRQIQFYGGVFTNLSQDHLDYHRDLEDYFIAKAMLFD
jgi:UDP-N-acetylmuramoyl-L-alanyl-D-glutamate--2,6-diaminopimelate ligase